MAVTIRQIAERAGLSYQTVSFVLNNKAHLFRPETRDKVLQAGKELGYRPNSMARAMRSGRFGSAGLIATTRISASHLSERLTLGIHDALSERDMHLVLARFPDDLLTSEGVVPKLLRELMTDGLLISYTQDIPEKMRSLIADHHIPSIWMNAEMEQDCVLIGDLAGGQAATEHLLRLGHRRIAYADYLHSPDQIIGRSDHYSIADRYEGYRRAMGAAGLEPRLLMQNPPLKPFEIREVPTSWMDAADRPTAVVCYSGYGLATMLFAARSRGLCMPRDFTMVAFAETPFDIDGFVIDTMVVPEAEMGRAAVEMLLEKIEEPDRAVPARTVPVGLVEAGHPASGTLASK